MARHDAGRERGIGYLFSTCNIFCFQKRSLYELHSSGSIISISTAKYTILSIIGIDYSLDPVEQKIKSEQQGTGGMFVCINVLHMVYVTVVVFVVVVAVDYHIYIYIRSTPNKVKPMVTN